MQTTPDLPPGWTLDPDCEQVADHIPGQGFWWVIAPDGTRTAWNEALHECPVCRAHIDLMPDCRECKGRGQVDTIPYCERPWDLIAMSKTAGELWLGGIHCQFGGTANGPGAAGAYKSEQGNAFPGDLFDVVLSLINQPDYDPAPGVEHHTYRIADADLDPVHHTHLDYLAERVQADVQNGKKVLVRCQAGINRSALVVGLAMLKIGTPLDTYLEHARQARSPYVLFNRSFVQYLREVEARSQADSYVMANANPCTVHPQHVMVNQGRREDLEADLFACACGETAIGNLDEGTVRRG